LIGVVHHKGTPFTDTPFGKVDDTRRYRDAPQAVTEAHLRLNFGLSAVAFST
jgi:hypothetical protein